MRKLKLDLDHLRVESFAAEAALADAGTVHGHDMKRVTFGLSCQNSNCNSACVANCTGPYPC
ncbi:MAG TPA: hypothetical protein VF092_01730 [Longimicrobium sp.]